MKSEFEWQDELLEYRKTHFAVEVSSAEHPVELGEITLSITHNGSHWQSVKLLKSEVRRVIEALSNSL